MLTRNNLGLWPSENVSVDEIDDCRETNHPNQVRHVGATPGYLQYSQWSHTFSQITHILKPISSRSRARLRQEEILKRLQYLHVG